LLAGTECVWPVRRTTTIAVSAFVIVWKAIDHGTVQETLPTRFVNIDAVLAYPDNIWFVLYAKA
jgi:hypothetical protein